MRYLTRNGQKGLSDRQLVDMSARDKETNGHQHSGTRSSGERPHLHLEEGGGQDGLDRGF